MWWGGEKSPLWGHDLSIPAPLPALLAKLERVFKGTGRIGGSPLLLPLLWPNWLNAHQLCYSFLRTEENNVSQSPLQLESWAWILVKQPVQPWPLKHSVQPSAHSPLPIHEAGNRGLQVAVTHDGKKRLPCSERSIRPALGHDMGREERCAGLSR